ncbi:hypothetical protein HDU84_005891 [Entophlyctis sp. JEL0112]|nr:hypothetical protein HDU84_005891 [Entophlyctis sp. JEL0112]
MPSLFLLDLCDDTYVFENLMQISNFYLFLFRKLLQEDNLENAKIVLAQLFSKLSAIASTTKAQDSAVISRVFETANRNLFLLEIKELSMGLPRSSVDSNDSPVASPALSYFSKQSPYCTDENTAGAVNGLPRSSNTRSLYADVPGRFAGLCSDLRSRGIKNSKTRKIAAGNIKKLLLRHKVHRFKNLDFVFATPTEAECAAPAPVEPVTTDSDRSPDSVRDMPLSIAPSSLTDGSSKLKKQPHAGKAKKAKATVAVVETEEQKAKRLLFADLINLMRMHQSDDEKLCVLSEGLLTVCGQSKDIRLSILEKSSGKAGANPVFNAMLDVAFELLTTENDTLTLKGGTMSSLACEVEPTVNPASEIKIGKLPTLQEITTIIQKRLFQRFDSGNIMVICRQLFRMHQWERFAVVAQILEQCLSERTTQTQSEKILTAELALRAAFINFHNVWHSERKVMFESSREEITQTTEDLRAKKLKLSSALQNSASALIQAISESLELMHHSKYQHLFLDIAKHLSSFVEPFMDQYESLDGSSLKNEIQRDETIVQILLTIHVLVSEFPTTDMTFGVSKSYQLAKMLERCERFEESLEVLTHLADRIKECRKHLGNDTPSIHFLADHAGIRLTEELPADRSSDLKSKCCQEMANFEVNVYLSIFRCDLKKKREAEMCKEIKRKTEYERLKKKYQVPSLRINICDMDKLCAENLVVRALMMMAHASAHDCFPYNTRITLLVEAAKCLENQQKIEKAFIRDNSKPCHPKIPMRCPKPTITSRTPTSISIRPNHMLSDTGYELVPAFYQAYCREFGEGGVALNDVNFRGTGTLIKYVPDLEITIFGLLPNKKYMFAVAAFDEAEQMIGYGIGESSKWTTTMYSLPLALCWSKIALLAHEHNFYEVADKGFEFVWNHCVTFCLSTRVLAQAASCDNTGVGHPQVFYFHEQSLKMATPEFLNNFVFCLSQKVDRQASNVNSTSNGRSYDLRQQVNSLVACSRLMVAAEILKLIGNFEWLLDTVAKIFARIFPFFKLGIDTPFALHTLLIMHGHILLCENAKVSLDSSDTLNIFVPLVTVLINRLTNRKEYSTAIYIADQSLKYLNSRGTPFNTSINNSATIELEWTGFVTRTKRYAANQRKNMLLNIQSENLHHIIVAVTHNYRIGYAEKRKKLEIFRESLEYTLEYCATLMKPPVITERRFFDASTTLKEIFKSFVNFGVDFVYSEMSKFKKNPRYLEIITYCAQWALVKGGHETVIKICSEVFEFLAIRNVFLTNASQLTENGENSEKKQILQRKKRPLFIEKVATNENAFDERKSRSKHRRKYNRNGKNINSLVDGGSVRERSVNESHMEEQASPFSSRGGSRASSNESRKSRSRNQSAERQNPDARSGLRGIGRKRKKMALKNQLLANIPQAQRERVEKAASCLDKGISSKWKQSRFRRRLREIQKQEAPWKSRLSLFQALSLMKRLNPDLFGNITSVLIEKTLFCPNASDSTPNQSLIHAIQPRARMFLEFYEKTETVGQKKPEVQQTTVCEILQCTVQSIVHASRVRLWNQVVDGCQVLWNIICILTSTGYISSEFVSTQLWKPLFIASDYLMDMLDQVSIVDLNENDRFVSYEDMASRPLKATWKNVFGETECRTVEISWYTKFLLFSFDCMGLASVKNRLLSATAKFNDLFGGILSVFITQPSSSVLGALLKGRNFFSRFQSQTREKKSTLETSLNQLEDFTVSFESYEASLKLEALSKSEYWLPVIYNECGDLWFAKGDFKESEYFWSQSLDSLFGTKSFARSRKLPFNEIDAITDRLGSSSSIFFAAIISLKLSELSFHKDMEIARSLHMLSTHLLVTILKQDLLHPSDLINYSTYIPLDIFPLAEPFSVCFNLDPYYAVELLEELVEALCTYEKFGEALAVSSIISYIGADILVDDRVFTLSLLLKGKVLSFIGYFIPAFEFLQSILSGEALLQNRRVMPSTTNADSMERVDNEKIFLTAKNVVEAEMNSVSAKIYGTRFLQRFEILRCEICATFLKITDSTDPLSSNTIAAFVTSQNFLSKFFDKPDEKHSNSLKAASEHFLSYFPRQKIDYFGSANFTTTGSILPILTEMSKATASRALLSADIAQNTDDQGDLNKTDPERNVVELLNIISKRLTKAIGIFEQALDEQQSFSFVTFKIMNILSNASGALSLAFQQQCRVDLSIQRGLFGLAKELAEVGTFEAKEFRSKAFEISLNGLALLCQAQMTDSAAKNGKWTKQLSKQQQLILQETVSSKFTHARFWEQLGDIVLLSREDGYGLEASVMAYSKAEDSLHEAVSTTPTTVNSSLFAHQAAVMYKRALWYQKAGNLPEAYTILKHALYVVSKGNRVLSKHLSLKILLTFFHISYNDRRDRNEPLKSLCMDIILTEISSEAADSSNLRSAFEGALALAIEEGDEALARQFCHCLCYVTQMDSINASSQPTTEINTVDLASAELLSQINLGRRCKTLSDLGNIRDIQERLPENSVKLVKEFRQELMGQRQDNTQLTTDLFNMHLSPRIRRITKLLASMEPSFSAVKLFELIDFSTLARQSTIPKELLDSVVTTPMTNKTSSACIYWLNLAIRTNENSMQIASVSDKTLDLMICFEKSQTYQNSTSRTGDVTLSEDKPEREPANNNSASHASLQLTVSEDNPRNQGKSQPSSARSRRLTVANLSRRPTAAVPVAPDVGSSQKIWKISGPNIFTVKVQQGAVEGIFRGAVACAKALRKFAITKDEEQFTEAERCFNECLENIVLAIVKTNATSQVIAVKPQLSLETVVSIQRMFAVSSGYVSQNAIDAAMFEWLQQLVHFRSGDLNGSKERTT